MGILLQSLGLGAGEAGLVGDYETNLPALIPSRSDRPMSLETVVGLPGVYRSAQIITTIGSRVPFNSWRDGQPVERQPVVIRKPDQWRNRRSWSMRALTCMFADGNTFLRLSQDALQQDRRSIVSAPNLNPFAVSIRRDKTGRKVYDHRTRDGLETLSSEQVEHIWLNEFPGFDRGLSPITACRLSLSGALDTRDYASSFFDTGAVPPGVLTSDQPIDGETAKHHQTRWHDGDSSKIKVMGKGLKFEPILISPEDAQWIEAQKFNVLDVGRMTGIPPILLAAAIEGSSLTYQNLQDVQEHLVSTLLGPVYLDALAAGLTELLPAGQEVRHDYAGLLRRDDQYRMKTHKTAIDSGIYSADEARAFEGIAGPAPTTRKADA